MLGLEESSERIVEHMTVRAALNVYMCVYVMGWQDFGDYSDDYYSVQTTEGEQISQLIAGYIDIIVKKVDFLQQFPSVDLLHQ